MVKVMDPCFLKSVPKMAKLENLSSKSCQNIATLPDYADESTKSSNRREKKVLKSLAIQESSPMLVDPYHTNASNDDGDSCASFEVRLPKSLTLGINN